MWAEFMAGDDALAAPASRGYRVGNAGRFLSDTNGELVYPTYLEWSWARLLRFPKRPDSRKSGLTYLQQ